MSSRIRRPLIEPRIDMRLLDERGPTQERMDKADGFDKGDTGMITVRQSTVERAIKRGKFDHRQGRAAEKLYMHWYRAGMAGSLKTCDPMHIFSSANGFSHLTATETGEFHWNRLRAACEWIVDGWNYAGHNGREALKITECVVCKDMTFEQAALWAGHTSKRDAERYAIDRVKGSLNILSREWGID